MSNSFRLLTLAASVAVTGCAAPQNSQSPGLTGTVWIGPAADGGTMHCEFLAGERMRMSTAEGTWQQNDVTVTMNINNGYATYRGTINGTTMSGTAQNTAGKTWAWSVTKAP